MITQPILYVVVPCYDEEMVLPYTSKLLLEQLRKMINSNRISGYSKIMFVNDGSNDETWEIIKNLADSDEHFIGISLSKNMGHQNAVLGGLWKQKKVATLPLVLTVMDKMILAQ